MSEQKKMDAERAAFESHPHFKGMDFTRNEEVPQYYNSPYANGALDGWMTARASLPVGVPDGYALVPVEPTDEMRDAGNVHTLNRSTLFRSWHAMLAAAPTVKESLSVAQVKLAPYDAIRKLMSSWDDLGPGESLNVDAVREWLDSAPTVKAEQVQCGTCHGQGEICVGQQTFGYMSMQPPEPIMDVCPECGGEEAPSLPAAGSAAEEVEPIGYAWINRYNQAVDHVAPFPPTEGGVSYGERLMTVAQHNRIDGQRQEEIAQLRADLDECDGERWKLRTKVQQLEALSAQQSAQDVSVPVELLERIRDCGDAEIAVFRDDNNGPGEWMCPACESYSNGTWRDGKLQPFPGIAHDDDCWLEQLRALLNGGEK